MTAPTIHKTQSSSKRVIYKHTIHLSSFLHHHQKQQLPDYDYEKRVSSLTSRARRGLEKNEVKYGKKSLLTFLTLAC